MFAKVVHRQLRSRDVALAMVDGEVMAGTMELRAKRQKFEAMSSKAAQAAVEVKRQKFEAMSSDFVGTGRCGGGTFIRRHVLG